MNTTSYDRVFATLVGKCADAGKALARQNAVAGDCRPLELHYRAASGNAHGEMILVAQGDKVPPGFLKATDQELHCGIPYLGYGQWVRERASRLPILGAC